MQKLRLQACAQTQLAVLLTTGAVCVSGLGCGVATNLAPVAGPAAAVAVSGSVHGGQQPIANAQIVLFAAGTSADGSNSTSLMKKVVYTDSQGGFTLTGAYTCPSTPSQVFVVSIAGNPGLPDANGVTPSNTSATLMTVLGLCSSLTASTFININELTTVSSVAALLPYIASYTAIGSGSSDASALATAMSTVNEYVNITTGSVPGPSLPSGYSASTDAVEALANVVAACINSAGGFAGSNTACGNLFTLATPPGGSAPTDTIGAVVDILKNPSNNSSALFNLAACASPFQPALSSAPSNWALPIVASNGGSIEFSNLSYSVQEGLTYLALTVTLSNANSAASISYATQSGTALSGTDFQAISGTLTWAAGNNAAQRIVVPLLNPGNSTGNRVFTVALSNPQSGASLGTNALATITINGSSVSSQVAALPVTTPMLAIKKAALTWWLNAAYSAALQGNSTESAGLLSDISNALPETFTVPTSLPTSLFPTVPSIGSNPSVAAANAAIGTSLTSDATTRVLYDTAYASNGDIGTALETAENMISALMMPGQPYYLDSALVPAVLTRMENSAYSIVNADIADIDDDTEFPILYMMLTQGWTQLVPPTLQSVWQNDIATNTAAEISQNGAHLEKDEVNSFGVPGDLANDWLNSDVRHLLAIVYGEMIAGTPLASTSPLLEGGLEEMSYSLLPDGGTKYTDQQNEAFTYHSIYVREMSRYSMVTGDSTGTTLAAGTRFYTPLSLIFPYVGEYVTAPSWKKYWNETLNNEAMEIVVGLTGDSTSQWQLNSVGYPASYYDASFYVPNATATPQPANWITYDANAEGPRGVEGTFSFMSTTRPTVVSTRGKASYVGGIVLNSVASGSGWTLNAAVESAGAVVLKATGAELVTASTYGANSHLYADSQNEFNASTTTSTFGAVSTVNNLSGYETSKSTWVQDEAWVLLPTRVIGLVSVSNSATESAFELDGGFKLVSGRASWGTQKTFSQLGTYEWQYGNMVVQVYAHDYAGSRTELTNTWEDTANKAGWILLEDAHNSTTSAYSFPAGTSHYFVADFRPSSNVPAMNVERLSLAAGLQGFSFVDGGVTYTMVQNTTASPISYTPPAGSTVTMSGAQYRAPWIDVTGSESVPSAIYAGVIPAYSHIVTKQ